MKKYTKITALILMLTMMLLSVGCTLPSTKIAQAGAFRAKAVEDGVHRDMFKALSRSNYEIAKQNVLLAACKLKEGKTDAEKAAVDAMVKECVAGLTEFAKQRDFMVEWDRDRERAGTLRAVTVDQYIFSQQGILNYIGETLSDGTKDLLRAWDAAKEKWDANQ